MSTNKHLVVDPVFFAWDITLQQIWQVQGHYACVLSSEDNCLGNLAGRMIGQYQVWSSILVLFSSWFDVSLSTLDAESWVSR